MRAPRVDLAAGAGYDLLISAVAVADADWGAVLTHGAEVTATVRRAGGARVAQDAARFGRFGWINLCGLLAADGLSSREELIEAVAALSPTDLHVLLVGGRREQLAARVDLARIAAAVEGDSQAWADVRRALAAPGTLLEISPWLRRTASPQVRATLLRTLDAWPEVGEEADRRAGLRAARTLRRQNGAEALLRLVTAGIQYGPSVLQRVVLVSSRLVEPIIIWVDLPALTVIVHPPVGAAGITDAGRVLMSAGAAVGDETRVRILGELRSGARTLAELCASLDRPRTTLLHHLALLRAAGLVTLAVSNGEPNVYRLDPSGFDALSRAARGFVLG